MHYNPKPRYIKDFGEYDTVSLSTCKSPLNICIILKDGDSKKSLVLLRNTLTAKVYLGCIVDSSNQIFDWIEIWIQETQPLFYDLDNSQYNNSNSFMDQEWVKNIEQLAKLQNFDLINTGWEKTNPLPLFLDSQLNSPSTMKDSQTGETWQLCTDDLVLRNNHLPLYSTSIHRYLYLPSLTNNPRFIAIYDFSPKNDSSIFLKDHIKEQPNLLPLNPSAALMLIRKYQPLDLESLIGILSNSAAPQISSNLSTHDSFSSLKTFYINSHASYCFHRLFCDTRNSFSKTFEIFYLKLQLFTEMISTVYGFVKSSQKPIFNLCPASWQIGIIPTQSYLPVLWTTHPVLIDPGSSTYLKIPGTDKGYYTSSFNYSDLSIYRPASISLKTKGYASIRIRQISPDTDSCLSLDGTFFSDERLGLATNDLVRLHLNLSSEQIECYAVLESDPSLTPGQWRFRTLRQQCNEQQKAILQNAIGVHLGSIPFLIIPHLSTPCDLYSLAVLGIRIFIVNGTNSLPIALDEMLSLARSVSLESDPAAPLSKQIELIFKKDSRWANALGIQHLTAEVVPPDSAAKILPSTFWYELLAILIQMIPGATQESICKDYGDAPIGALHVLFEKPIEHLECLLMRTRGIIFHDWKANQQLYNVIDKFSI